MDISSDITEQDLAWAPAACTLPTPERPLRVAEFDNLFVTSLIAQHRLNPTRLRWLLDPAAEAAARDLTERESGCCSFFTFTFTFTTTGGQPERLQLDVDVPPNQVAVLDALSVRASERIRP